MAARSAFGSPALGFRPTLLSGPFGAVDVCTEDVFVSDPPGSQSSEAEEGSRCASRCSESSGLAAKGEALNGKTHQKPPIFLNKSFFELFLSFFWMFARVLGLLTQSHVDSWSFCMFVESSCVNLYCRRGSA